MPGTRPGRIAVCGHVDVVTEGTEPWRYGPWSGRIEDGHVHGRGALDMKGGVIAALHALAELREGEHPEVVLLAVASEEDGGLGAFAALERDAAFDACLIPEPTSFEVVCAQAGALTFRATVRGRAAHAAMRLAGRSALDRYVGIHLAIQAHERAINRDVEHPAMRALALPYPVSVGRIDGGDWPSSVPDRVTVEGRRRRAARAPISPTPAPPSRPRSTTARRRPSRSSGPAASSRPAPPRPSTRGWRRSPPRCGPSAAPRRASPACPTAPTCGCSAPAGSRP